MDELVKLVSQKVMLLNQELSPLSFLLQDAPVVSPLILAIIAVLLVILFIWLLLQAPKVEQPAAVETVEQPVEQATPAAEPIPTPASEVLAASAEIAAEVDDQAADNEPGEVVMPVTEDSPVPAVEAAVSSKSAGDDLEIIEGIGPKIAGVLRQAGITTFEQLADMEPAQITEILHSANLRLADPSSWPEQARLAAAGDHAGLQALQDRLRGGRG